MGDDTLTAVRPQATAELGEFYRRYRLADRQAEQDMARSLLRYGQLAPIVGCCRGGAVEVLDGFKRLAAARALGWTSLSARLLDADERTAKAAIYGLNRTGRGVRHWEEAWIVFALVREDGLTQAQTAELLGRHKSWVCRRLALVEKLAEPIQTELRLGLLGATAARSLVRLPAGNQVETLSAARRESLNAHELDNLIDLLAGAASRTQQDYVLAQPRQALEQAAALGRLAHDPRLSRAGNQLARRLSVLLDNLARLEAWLLQRGRADVTAGDSALLQPLAAQLIRAARRVADLSEDWIEEGRLP